MLSYDLNKTCALKTLGSVNYFFGFEVLHCDAPKPRGSFLYLSFDTQTGIKYLWILSNSIPHRYVPFTCIHLSIFKFKICEITFKTVRKSLITTLSPILHTGTRLFQNLYKTFYQSHMLAFFTITTSNKRHPPVYILHLKCFPIKG